MNGFICLQTIKTMSLASKDKEVMRWEEVQQRFSTLSRALQRSKFTETELLSKCRELKGALVEKAHQLQLAQATKFEDEHTIQSLRAEMQKAVSKADSSFAREQAARQLVIDLQQEIENLRAKLQSEVLKDKEETQQNPKDELTGGVGQTLDSLKQSPFEEWKQAKLSRTN